MTTVSKSHSKETHLIKLALDEDLGRGDVTSLALFKGQSRIVQARFVAKQPMILAGLDIAQKVFQLAARHPSIQYKSKKPAKFSFRCLKKEGAALKMDQTFAVIEGPALLVLAAERTALNFLQHLSGVATQTQHFVEKVKGTCAEILDTRKTLPGWRLLEKQAVKLGGGVNHRMGLYDAYLIKDNHLALYGSITQAVQQVRKHNRRQLKIEVEADTLNQFREAMEARVDWILLDNMPLEDMRLAVMMRNQIDRGKKGSVILEASGGVNLNNVRAVAQTGVDYISVGALTHSAPAVDISLEMIRLG